MLEQGLVLAKLEARALGHPQHVQDDECHKSLAE